MRTRRSNTYTHTHADTYTCAYSYAATHGYTKTHRYTSSLTLSAPASVRCGYPVAANKRTKTF